jgi:hypothetical protein
MAISNPGAFITRILGATGAAGPDITYQVLDANSGTNTTVNMLGTNSLVMSTTGVGVGYWRFRYMVWYQTAVATTGISIGPNHTGTFSAAKWQRSGISTGQAATTGLQADTRVHAGAAGWIVEGSTLGGAEGFGAATPVWDPAPGVQNANTPVMEFIEGLFHVTATGTLELRQASEIATSGVICLADTNLELIRMG